MDNTTPADYSLSIASLEIIALLVGSFILGMLLCHLLRALGLCCRRQHEEPSLFALQEPSGGEQATTPLRSAFPETPQLDPVLPIPTPAPVANDIPDLDPEPSRHSIPMPTTPEPASMPEVETPNLNVTIPAAVREHRPEDDEEKTVMRSGYVADINSLIRSNDNASDDTPTATRLATDRKNWERSENRPHLSLADLLTTPVERIDNLRKLEGIGPRIEALLNEAGIMNYQQLASIDPAELRGILEKGGEQFSIHDPKTWPYQAELAAKGEWDSLKEYQRYLLSGRD